MKTTNNKGKFVGNIIFRMIAIILIVLLVSYVCIYALLIVLYLMGYIKIPINEPSTSTILILVILIGIFVATILSIYLSKIFLKPIQELKESTQKVANGDFNVKITKAYRNEMGELITNFNIMVEELKRNETLKNDFISNVSHEFKTPLSTIQGYATLLQDKNLSEEDRNKYLNNIITSTKKLNNLVNNILKISKIENKVVSLEKHPFRVDEQIRECILDFEKEVTEKKIKLDVKLDNVTLNSNYESLNNVWNNLISNAIKYSYMKGQIHIRLFVENNKVIFKIKDHGEGIPEEALPYIFDKFYQADSSHSSEGNGLGLALVKNIIRMLDGKINVKSQIKQGSEFIITLPL